MDTKKRWLSVILTIALLLTALSAFAESTGTPPGDPPGGFDGGNPPGDPPGEPPEGFGGANPPGDPPGGFGGGNPPGAGASGVTYTAATEINAATGMKTQIDGVYVSDTADENALLLTQAGITLDSPTVSKTGDSDGGDTCSFYGVNAAVLIKDAADVVITGGLIETSANGANAVFCYGGNGGRNGADGDGSTLHIENTVIFTTGDGSGGIMTTGGGVTDAKNLTVTTSGRSSAAIRTDRGGGQVTVDGGTYTTNGPGSPAIYSTADVAVKNAVLVSNMSEGMVIEGKNAITLENCDLTANNTSLNGHATFLDAVMIYQSMSGDADSGTSSFTMTGGSLTSLSGHMFHVTNTSAVITLSGVNLVNEGSDILLSVCSDGWTGASNAAELVADSQVLSGAVLVGDDSSLTLALTNGSSFEGYINGEILNAAGEQISADVGTVSVSLDASSVWTLTADTYITEFSGNPANVTCNGYTLYVNGAALEGTN